MEKYTRTQVAKLLGVDPRKIEGWVARGVLRPEGIGKGTGNPYRFSFAEIVRASIIHHTQEDLGSQFIRPGSLSKLLHEQLSDQTITQERRRIEKVFSEERRRGKDYFPILKPHDLILHIYRSVEQKDDGTWEGIDLRIKIMPHSREGFFPSFVNLRIVVAFIIRSLVVRLDRMELSGDDA